ncbi:MAG TPA: response regulator transcription factor [Wenzhouxiangella sp.]|nr:response regulator transcription factor [Wenzhouxiangella sp.]
MITIVLAEDQTMLRSALVSLLAMEKDIEVLAAVADGNEAWQAVQQQRPDVLVTDIEMPGMSGIEVAARIRDRELETRTVIITTFARAGYLRRALEAGVRGYLLKDAPTEQLAAALRTVHGGGRAIDPELALEAWGEADPLTDRERQVLRLVGEGLSNRDIAKRLNLAAGTVRNYLSEAMSKLDATSRIEAWRTAHQKGWL